MNQSNLVPNADIKWFELFFDILIVVGISHVLHNFDLVLDDFSLVMFLGSIIMLLILLNTWTRVLVFENKIKVLERHFDQIIYGYQPVIMMQFFLIFSLICISDNNANFNLNLFLLVYMLLTITNMYLYNMKSKKLIVLILIFIISQFNFLAFFAHMALLIFIFDETYYTYRSLETLSNSIFRKSKFQVKLSVSDEIDNLPKKYLYKFYIPHLIERIGIVMIVFMAEYVLTIFNELESQFFVSFLFMVVLWLFYKDFFSIIEHYDDKLMLIKNRIKRTKKTKRTVYLTIFYFVVISSLTLFIMNFNSISTSIKVIIFMAYVIFEFVNAMLLMYFDDIKENKLTILCIYKIVCVLILLLTLFMSNNGTYILLSLIIVLLINNFTNRYNNINYNFK